MWPQLARSWGQRCCCFGLAVQNLRRSLKRDPNLSFFTPFQQANALFDVATNPNPSERPLMWANVQKE